MTLRKLNILCKVKKFLKEKSKKFKWKIKWKFFFIFLVKFKYNENDIKTLYEKIKGSKILEKLPDFNKTKSEIIREKAKDLSKNFFSENDHRDRAFTIQGQLNDLSIKIKEESENKEEKKKIKLNVDSPKFTAKANPKIAENLTFNPLNNISNNNKNAFNKFDEFDPSS